MPFTRPLSDREWEICNLYTTGYTTKEIAEKLFITKETVHSHVNKAVNKMPYGEMPDRPSLFKFFLKNKHECAAKNPIQLRA